jgi:hypothetical protein
VQVLGVGQRSRTGGQARAENVALLRRVSEHEWERRGTQEGVGPIGLCDVPAMMTEHDAAHRVEIEAWVESYRKR